MGRAQPRLWCGGAAGWYRCGGQQNHADGASSNTVVAGQLNSTFSRIAGQPDRLDGPATQDARRIRIPPAKLRRMDVL
jgi:hypothetical protein